MKNEPQTNLLKSLIEKLDGLLTSEKIAKRHIEWLEDFEPKWLDYFCEEEKVFYLSDGGYSRLIYNGDKLMLCGESTSQTKERWETEAVQRLIEKINKTIKTINDNNEKEVQQKTLARTELAYATVLEQNSNMQSALQMAVDALEEYGEDEIVSDIKAVWKGGINGLEDWRKYEDAFDEEQIKTAYS